MRSFKYIQYLLKRKCLREYMEAVNFHMDTKEISECLGMIKVVKEVMRGQEVTTAFDIGCGKRPTLGILIALEIKSINNIVSIDPQLDLTLAQNIKGLYLYRKTLQEYLKIPAGVFQNALICVNHGHIQKSELQLLFDQCVNWTYVTCPCCIDNRLEKGLFFKDKHINSPKNSIYVFRKEG